MLTLRHSRFARTIVIPLTFFAFLSGCHKWVPLQTPYATAIAMRQPDRVRATLLEGNAVELELPRVTGDSLFGFNPGSRDEGSFVQLSIADIHSLDERKSNYAPLLVVGVLAVAIFFFVALVQAEEDGLFDLFDQ